MVNSPNHPLFGDDADDVDGAGPDRGRGQAAGESGQRDSRHCAAHGQPAAGLAAIGRLRLGADINYRTGVYLRGDEINVLGRTGSFVTLNLHGEYRFTPSLSAFARIENVFDTDYETFGLLGEPDEVFEDFEDPRFLGAAPPRGIWVGLRLGSDPLTMDLRAAATCRCPHLSARRIADRASSRTASGCSKAHR